MTPEFLERIDKLPDVFMLCSIVQFKYVQTISKTNDDNFMVGMAGGLTIFGESSQYKIGRAHV